VSAARRYPARVREPRVRFGFERAGVLRAPAAREPVAHGAVRSCLTGRGC
jgi:hypothetical protein